MTCYKFECSYWLKSQHSDWRANLVKDSLKIDFPPMRALEIVTGHVIYNLAYTYLQIPTENHPYQIRKFKIYYPYYENSTIVLIKLMIETLVNLF